MTKNVLLLLSLLGASVFAQEPLNRIPDNCSVEAPKNPSEEKIDLPKPFGSFDDIFDGYCKMQNEFHKPVMVSGYTAAMGGPRSHPDGINYFQAAPGLTKKQFAAALIEYLKKTPITYQRIDVTAPAVRNYPALTDVYVPRQSIQLTVHDVVYADIHWDITERFRVNLTQVIRHFQTASYSFLEAELPAGSASIRPRVQESPTPSHFRSRLDLQRMHLKPEDIMKASGPAPLSIVKVMFPFTTEAVIYRSIDPAIGPDGRGIALFTAVANKYAVYQPDRYHPRYVSLPAQQEQVLAQRTDGIIYLSMSRTQDTFNLKYERQYQSPNALAGETVVGSLLLNQWAAQQVNSVNPTAAARVQNNNPF